MTGPEDGVIQPVDGGVWIGSGEVVFDTDATCDWSDAAGPGGW